jgi:hypothetical protein
MGKTKRRYGERKRDENNNERVRENMGGGEIEKERQTYRGRVSIGEGAERKIIFTLCERPNAHAGIPSAPAIPVCAMCVCLCVCPCVHGAGKCLCVCACVHT